MRAEEFLQQYRILEELLGSKYSGKPRKHATVVAEFLNDPESAPYEEALSLCREIRNLLTHNADQNGDLVVEPSAGVLRSLSEIIEYVKQPKSILTFATPTAELLKADLGDEVIPLMREMTRRGFAHLPVLRGARLLGVFSIGTVFQYMLQHPESMFCEDMRVSEFSEYLPVHRHASERFLFAAPEESVFSIKQEFSRQSGQNRRLSAIFVTTDGNADSALLGMITSWDILSKGVFSPPVRIQ